MLYFKYSIRIYVLEMGMEQLNLHKNIDISKLKHSFASHYPNSPILQTLLSLPMRFQARS
ncbi:hypothetical protein CPM_0900 [Cuniculiplasma divulgatum]|uniref:Uncharacterized protein n=1 Tax=Cuniculiplasma divulgatum TaxID=1673428 RepID=A0A1R4A721_9ARCH|nr:hypothetical protein CPM_0900 [Cuniculiplasma divulgatum]